MAKKKRFRGALILGIIGLAVLALYIGVSSLRSRAVAAEEVAPELGDITTYYSFSGAVEAKNRETILADRIMQIEDILVEPGQMVEAGDVLMETSSGKIRAAIDGEVSGIFVEENAQVLAGGRLADVVDYSSLQLRVRVDEYDLSAIEEGKGAVVTIHALARDVQGTVESVAREGIYANGITFFEAVISLETDEAIRIGMSAEARVLNQEVRDVITLPMTAIQFDDNNQPYVLVKTVKGPGLRQDLTLGINDGSVVEVREGITMADIILVPREDRFTRFGPPHRDSEDED